MLQALVYNAHISSTFPTKLQHIWKPPRERTKVGTEAPPHQCSPSNTTVHLGSCGDSGQLPEDVRSRLVEVLGERMSEIKSKVKNSQAMVPYSFEAPLELSRKARTLLQRLTHDLGAQVEDVRVKKGLLAGFVPNILPHLETTTF